MKYKVSCYHHRKAIVRGDLEAETILDNVYIFPTKKKALEYLVEKSDEAKYNRNKFKLNSAIRGKLPSLAVYTGVEWTHENTGEKEEEYYWYKTEKV